MTGPRPLWCAALAVALLAPSADAFEGNAVVGGGYSQTNNWSAGAADRIPVWNWIVGGSFHASPLSPGLLQLDAAGQYDALRNTAAQAPSNSNGLTFRAGTLLLGDYLPTSLYASRALSDFAVDAGTTLSGSSVIDTVGGNVRYQLSGGPLLQASASRTDQTTRPLVGDEYRSLQNHASVQASQNFNTLDYRLGYETTFSDGSFSDTNYRQHAVSFSGGADLTSEDRVLLSAQYSVRDPLTSAAANPRLDTEFLQATTMLGTQSRWSGFASYSYSHSLVEALGSPALEQANHGASYTATYRSTDALLLTATAGANYGVLRDLGESLTTTSEQAGVGATWTLGDPAELQFQLAGSGNAGALQIERGATLPGYGVGLTGNVRDTWGRWTGTATYQLTYARNLAALAGTVMNQRLGATADTKAAGVALGGRLSFQSARRDAALVGVSVDRSLTAGLTAAWKRLHAEATAGTADGLADTLRSPGFTDGLFFSPSFNTHSRYATLQVQHATTRRLRVGLLGRLLDTEAPARPREREASGSLTVAYDVGQFTFQLEDRVTQGGNGEIWARTNLLFARIERRFDLRF
jgi:hypothetical protein